MQTLTLIRSLLSDGLFEAGNVLREEGFVAWAIPLDESMQRIHDMYVTRYDDTNGWLWGYWLRLTKEDVPIARSAKDNREDPTKKWPLELRSRGGSILD